RVLAGLSLRADRAHPLPDVLLTMRHESGRMGAGSNECRTELGTSKVGFPARLERRVDPFALLTPETSAVEGLVARGAIRFERLCSVQVAQRGAHRPRHIGQDLPCGSARFRSPGK